MSTLGPDCLESIILKIIGKKIDNLCSHLESIVKFLREVGIRTNNNSIATFPKQLVNVASFLK